MPGLTGLLGLGRAFAVGLGTRGAVSSGGGADAVGGFFANGFLAPTTFFPAARVMQRWFDFCDGVDEDATALTAGSRLINFHDQSRDLPVLISDMLNPWKSPALLKGFFG